MLNEDNWIEECHSLKGKAYNHWMDWYTLIPFCMWNISLMINNNSFRQQKVQVNSQQALNHALEHSLIISKHTTAKTIEALNKSRRTPPPQPREHRSLTQMPL